MTHVTVAARVLAQSLAAGASDLAVLRYLPG
jgi:hypothetical protein